MDLAERYVIWDVLNMILTFCVCFSKYELKELIFSVNVGPVVRMNTHIFSRIVKKGAFNTDMPGKPGCGNK